VTDQVVIGTYRLGWRVWRAHEQEDGLYLASTHACNVWRPEVWAPRRRYEASCHAVHEAPHDRHPCGVHVFSEPEDAKAYMRSCWTERGTWSIRDPFVVGVVAYWGPTVVHARGARARFAYPQRLSGAIGLGRDGVDMRLLGIKYGIPTSADPLLEAS
jgi:hypothetical protein